jgi:hypothetical protein
MNRSLSPLVITNDNVTVASRCQHVTGGNASKSVAAIAFQILIEALSTILSGNDNPWRKREANYPD